ncbi:16S rRNA (cytidine(1402)-2'-O)-methyltransferase [Luteimicrobium subarcticum]|uniref:Ribosomal RNA small subunit methyltransferase I n=1 Tax=Luteimicrobium subarcticum TaxID=620910 RepID=A0A2M8WSX4_9MICO|nr:16S rRNA (cytidine(1402)-2'-O)-methyltransferase [Luteimicrobium subarcticum]PJI94055.1 16S rRNA (cytidine1402-2'-O)-methyltransferase [Luteimicrobium subarcticum]
MSRPHSDTPSVSPETSDTSATAPSDGPASDRPAQPVSTPERGSLVLAATPIGNTEDASPRLRRLLADADVVAAEDTRRLLGLAQRLGLRVGGRIVSYHEHNEADRADDLLDVVEGGGTVLVVTDAGMPSVSDPGYRVVVRAVERGLRVTTAPGPSAVLAALAVSGIPTDRFAFEGFLPRKAGDRARALAEVTADRRTLVYFEAPHRIADVLAAMADAFGADRQAAVCRELTKTYEEVLRGPLAELAERAAAEPLRGEICVVVAGAPRGGGATVDDLVPEVLDRVAGGERLKDAVGAVVDAAQARGSTVPKRDLYAAALAARGKA